MIALALEYRLRIVVALLLALCLSCPAGAVEKRSPSQAAAAAKKSGKKSKSRKPRKPASQTAPTPERYQQIQQALLAKGYGPQPANGVWTPDWAAALKHYQQDQKLEATGKLNSLSLITLGLGGAAAVPAASPAPAVPPASPGATAPPPPPDPPGSSSSTVRELK